MNIDYAERAALNIDNLSYFEIVALQNNSDFRNRVVNSYRRNFGFNQKLEPFINEIEEYGKKKNIVEEKREIHYIVSKLELIQAETIVKVIDKNLLELIKSNNNLLYSLSPEDFEDLFGDIMKNIQGFVDVHRTQSTHDKGVDLIGYFENPFGGKSKVIVGCKRIKENKAVNLDAIRALNSSQQHSKAPIALFATTGRFTRNIDKFIESEIHFGEMNLADAKKILGWINNT